MISDSRAALQAAWEAAPGGVVCLWLTLLWHRLVPQRDTGEVVDAAAARRLNAKLWRRIRRWLERRGIPAPALFCQTCVEDTPQQKVHGHFLIVCLAKHETPLRHFIRRAAAEVADWAGDLRSLCLLPDRPWPTPGRLPPRAARFVGWYGAVRKLTTAKKKLDYTLKGLVPPGLTIEGVTGDARLKPVKGKRIGGSRRPTQPGRGVAAQLSAAAAPPHSAADEWRTRWKALAHENAAAGQPTDSGVSPSPTVLPGKSAAGIQSTKSETYDSIFARIAGMPGGMPMRTNPDGRPIMFNEIYASMAPRGVRISKAADQAAVIINEVVDACDKAKVDLRALAAACLARAEAGEVGIVKAARAIASAHSRRSR